MTGGQWGMVSFEHVWGKRKQLNVCTYRTVHEAFVTLVPLNLIWLEVCIICFTFMEHIEYFLHLFNDHLSRVTQSGSFFKTLFIITVSSILWKEMGNPDSPWISH